MREPKVNWHVVGKAKSVILNALEREVGNLSFIELSIAVGQVINDVAKINAVSRLASGESPFNPDALGREDASR